MHRNSSGEKSRCNLKMCFAETHKSFKLFAEEGESTRAGDLLRTFFLHEEQEKFSCVEIPD